MNERLSGAARIVSRYLRLDRFGRPLLRDPWYVLALVLAGTGAVWAVLLHSWERSLASFVLLYWVGLLKVGATALAARYRSGG